MAFMWQSALVGPRSSKTLPKANLHLQKVMVTGGLLSVWSTTAFWIPTKHYIQEVCSADWWAAPKRPSSSPPQCLTAQPMLQKLKELGYEVLLHPHFLKHFDNFLQGKCFYNQEEVENAFQEFIESWSMDFCATGLSKLVSHWQKCVDCSGSYFD